MEGLAETARKRSSRLGLAVLAMLVAAVSSLAFTRVELTSGQTLSVPEAAYASLQLFTLNNGACPRSGTGWAAILWACYFIAPLVSASTLVSFGAQVWSDIRGPAHRAGQLRGHTVVAGYGKYTEALLANLAREKARKVVIIDSNGKLASPHHPEHREWPVLRGDFGSEGVLRAAGISVADEVYAASDQSFRNLAACQQAVAVRPGIRSYALVADPDLWDGLGDTVTDLGIEPINPYAVAARNWDFDGPVLVLAGFGGFGRAIVLEHGRGATRRLKRVVLIDRDADRKCRHLLKTYGRDDIAELVPIKGDIYDPAVFEQALTLANVPEPMVMLATGDDESNVEMALVLRHRWNISATVIVRLGTQSAGMTELAKRAGFRCVALQNLIKTSDLQGARTPPAEIDRGP
ncbi:MAG: NAD-binding protein [Myxococcales bacterium]|nr:NAD-binding protein [Myxococcales bacterium]